jgi:MFS family permease
MPYSNLFPVFAQTIFKGNVTTFSWLNSISGLGALFGAIYMTTIKPGKSLLRIIILSSLLFSVSLMLFAYSHSLFAALVFILVGESGMLAQIAATNTYVQTNVDEHMRGRVISYYVMAFQGMQPIGSLLVGWSAHAGSAQATVFLEGLAGVAIALLFIPALKRVKRMSMEKQLHSNS